MLAGNCILASDMKGQKLFMQKNKGIGFVYKHNDPKDLAAKILILFNNRILLNQCKEESRRIATSRYNWEIEVKSWLNLVHELTGERDIPYQHNELTAVSF